MPRIARIVIPDTAHHVMQHGNNRQDVFFAKDDYWVYLDLLKTHAERYGVTVMGYCLMTNHIHLVVKPKTEEGLAKAIGRTHYYYTQHVNRLHGRCGHLWQNRFYSCALDRAHTFATLRYVERNPVRARMVRQAKQYEFSSARAHCGGEDPTGLLNLAAWRRLQAAEDWRDVLKGRDDEVLAKSILSGLRTGRPLGSDGFVSKLEARLGRRLRAPPVGRPHKKKKGRNRWLS